MRNFLLLLAASSLLVACLPDPAGIFYDSPTTNESVEEEGFYDGESDSTDDFPDQVNNPVPNDQVIDATSSFSFPGQIVAKVKDDGDDDETIDFGRGDLSLYCAESIEADEPIGYIRVLIEAFLPSQQEAVMSWQQRLNVHCAGQIDFYYGNLSAGHNYSVKIDHLDLENKIIKTNTGNFSVPKDPTKSIPFELK